MAFKAAATISTLMVIANCHSGPSDSAGPKEARILLDTLVAEPAGRAVVAEVNGVPVYADCVKRQGEAHRLSPQEALDECIDFELLAQAAHQPEYLELGEVQEEGKQELVRNFIASKYSVQGPDDIPDELVQELWKQMSPRRYNRPELRDIVFCRIALDGDHGPDSELSKNAEKFLQGVYGQLKTRMPITKNELFAGCYGDPESEPPRPYEVAGVPKLDLQTFSPRARVHYQQDFRAAVFDQADKAGTLLPPLLSVYGWDLILVTLILPELVTEFADAEQELRKALFEEPVYEDRREALFSAWYAPLAARHKITRSYDHLPAAGPALGTGPGPAPTGAQP